MSAAPDASAPCAGNVVRDQRLREKSVEAPDLEPVRLEVAATGVLLA
jgi:hypothetical protein